MTLRREEIKDTHEFVTNNLGCTARLETFSKRLLPTYDHLVEVAEEGELITYGELAIDLLHALKGVESHHGISAECDVRGSNPHSRGTGIIPEELSFPPLYGLWPGQRGPIEYHVIAV